MIIVRNENFNLDTTKNDEKSKKELDDNSKQVRNSKNSHLFLIKENERVKTLSKSSIDAT